MGCEEISVHGYDEFVRVAREQQQRGQVFVYFSGDKDPASGTSWCPDCVKGKSTLLHIILCAWLSPPPFPCKSDTVNVSAKGSDQQVLPKV